MSANGDWRNHIRAQGNHVMALIHEECDQEIIDMFPYIEESIPKVFSAFQCGDPDSAQSMIDGLQEAKWVLEKDLRLHLGGAQQDMDGWKIALAVVGAIAGVAAAAVSGGTSLAVVGAISGSLISGGTSVANEVIDADSELGALLSINNNGLSVISKIDIERAKLEKALRDLAEYVSGAKLAEVRPARPVVITAPSFDPGSFGMTDEAQGKHKRPNDKTDLVPEPKRQEDGPYDKPIFGPDETDRYEEQGPS
ncbi:hypothetical protein ABZ345_17180 [Lentzea sp. NPDC005914]|uniref:hypothetical protein n=1 Tax=Lentzea sp. NPDC005914 TaxID=3154572 RepID=UPI0033DEF070